MARPTPLPPPVTTAEFMILLPPPLRPISSTVPLPPSPALHQEQPAREHHHKSPAYTAAGCESHPRIPTPDRNGTLPADLRFLNPEVSPATSRTRAARR